MSDGIEVSSLTIGASALSAILGAVAAWWKTKNSQPVRIDQQPVQVERPADSAFVTRRDCEYKMDCFRRDFVEEVRRLYDKIDEVKTLIVEGRK